MATLGNMYKATYTRVRNSDLFAYRLRKMFNKWEVVMGEYVETFDSFAEAHEYTKALRVIGYVDGDR